MLTTVFVVAECLQGAISLTERGGVIQTMEALLQSPGWDQALNVWSRYHPDRPSPWVGGTDPISRRRSGQLP